MIQCKCIQKFRDNSDRIYGYRIQDINGQTQDVTPSDLKKAIKNKKISVVNLSLTSDERLVDKKAEKQLQNTKLMPNRVEKPQNTNDRLLDILEKCANKIALAVTGKGVAMCIDHDTSIKNRVSAQFELERGIVYKGTERHLDILLDLESKDKCLYIGLLNTEDFSTEAEKSFEIKDEFKLDTVTIFVDEYIKYIKTLNDKKYKVIFNSLMLVDELDEDIENLVEEYDSDVKIIKIPNNVNIDSFIDNYIIDDYLYPYMDTENKKHIVRDWENTFIVAFIDTGYTNKVLFYSTDKTKPLNISVNNKRCKQCKYCEEVIGLESDEYLGYKNTKQSILKLEEALYKERNIILIEVTIQ